MRTATLLTSARFAKAGEAFAPIALPHTWNAKDGQDGGNDYWRGVGTYEIDGEVYIGTLDIPALELSLPVMSEWSYPKLKLAPCRYKGSAYRNDLIICAHNYNSHFGRLKELEPGDEIVFTDADGNAFFYSVVTTETLAPTAIDEMESSGWDLTLFTCTIGGAKRVTVRCKQNHTI